jgi:orotidine-5'-phosphate decarboxylase
MMTFAEKLEAAQKKNKSLVCAGLDPEAGKIPAFLKSKKDFIYEFNRAIVDATKDLVCCYKPQIAYYSGQGAEDQLLRTIEYIRTVCPEVPVIMDVKRGDIGSTAEMYAKEAFDIYKADAATVNPYMGTDALKPFLDRADKGVFILCRTSNPSASELQSLTSGGREIYKIVAELARDKWSYNKNACLVVGATCPDELGEIRKTCPEMTFLVPGVGAQGGDAAKVMALGKNSSGAGVVINSSRGIIHASQDESFAEKARAAAAALRELINKHR